MQTTTKTVTVRWPDECVPTDEELDALVDGRPMSHIPHTTPRPDMDTDT